MNIVTGSIFNVSVGTTDQEFPLDVVAGSMLITLADSAGNEVAKVSGLTAQFRTSADGNYTLTAQMYAADGTTKLGPEVTESLVSGAAAPAAPVTPVTQTIAVAGTITVTQ